MTLRWLRGDCRETLRTLEAGSVQCAITSPPYWSLRDYGTPPLVWGGDAGHAHSWQPAASMRRIYTEAATEHGTSSIVNGKLHDAQMGRANAGPGDVCPCGAWLGSLGLEPDPFMYIEHIVEVFREVRRVLRDDGVIWVNLGSSYAGSGKGPTGHNGIGDQGERQGFVGGAKNSPRRPSKTGQAGNWKSEASTVRFLGVPGFKAKDMIFMPGFVAEALRQDGWYFRAMLPWVKRNCMPSSVTDRPGTSLEYVLYLSKSRRCYWDADAVRIASPSSVSAEEYAAIKARGTWQSGGVTMHAGSRKDAPSVAHPSGRAFRDSDLFFQSWQGLLLDDDAEPMALVVNPAPLKLAHYASYPPKLVEPMVKASSRPGDWVLDPFAGSGTTLVVADRLGRNAIGCELSSEYGEMGTGRVVGDAPMFVELESA